MVSSSPTPEPAPEITIDLDGGSKPEPPPPRPRISNAALAFTTALLMLAAGAVVLVKWLPVGDRAAEETVRSFLEAVRSGDVDEALALADEAVGGSEEFLVPEALDDRWAIVEVAQVAYDESPQGSEAQVYAEIEAYDGTRLGHRYRVRFEEDGPVILNAFSRTDHLGGGGAVELELNGYAPDPVSHTHMLVLPGVYVPHESQPETVELGMHAFLALGDQFIELGAEDASSGLPGRWPLISEAGHQALEQAVRVYLDGCAEHAPSDGCPFAPPEGDRIAVPADATWEIAVYPQVSGTYMYGADDEGHVFGLFATEPGSVEVDAVVTDADGTERQARLSCGIWMENVDAVFDTAGGVTLSRDSEAAGACDVMVEVV